MTQTETIQLLKFLSKFWANLVVDDDTIDAWHVIFVDEPFADVVSAARKLVKVSNSPFPPTPGMVLQQKSNQQPPRALAVSDAWQWFTSPGSRKSLPPPSEVHKAAWESWGGQRRWGSLPDPNWAPNPAEAHKVISFAKKEFESLCANYEQAPPTTRDKIEAPTNVINLIDMLTKERA